MRIWSRYGRTLSKNKGYFHQNKIIAFPTSLKRRKKKLYLPLDDFRNPDLDHFTGTLYFLSPLLLFVGVNIHELHIYVHTEIYI